MMTPVIPASSSHLNDKLVSCHRDFLDCLIGVNDLDVLAEQWRDLAEELCWQDRHSRLQPWTAALGALIAKNVSSIGTSARDLSLNSDDNIDELSKELQLVYLEHTTGKRHGDELEAYPKRARREDFYASPISSDASSDSDSDYSPAHHTKHHIRQPLSRLQLAPVTSAPSSKPNQSQNDHLRVWFLSHLSHPYPTPEGKEHLSAVSSLPRSKIDSDLTNWRRRAGWTDIKDRWAGGDKVKMRKLVQGVERGTERNQGIVEEVEKMRGYLERREEERVGDWVHELTSLVEKKPKHADEFIFPYKSSEPDHNVIAKTSQSSISTVSNQVPHLDSPSFMRSSSASSSNSSNSSAYLFNPAPSLKRDLPADLDVVPDSSGQRMRFDYMTPPSDMEPLWLNAPTPFTSDLPTPRTSPTPPMSANMWSTDTPIDMLPHMSMRDIRSMPGAWDPMSGNTGSGFEVPQQWEFDFQPVLNGWAEPSGGGMPWRIGRTC